MRGSPRSRRPSHQSDDSNSNTGACCSKPDRNVDSPNRSDTNLYPGNANGKDHSKSKCSRRGWNHSTSTTDKRKRWKRMKGIILFRSHHPSNNSTEHRTYIGLSNGPFLV